MASESSSEITFVAGEARADVFAGSGAWLYGGLLLLLQAEYADAAWVLVVLGVYMLWRGVRSWRKPYVSLSCERMVIFDRGHPKHYVRFDCIAAVQRSFNRTRLVMRDGLKIQISHLGFLSKGEVDRFRAELSRRVKDFTV